MTRAAPPAPLDVESIRQAEFPGVADGIYLNAASVTPLPLRARQVIARLHDRRAEITPAFPDFAGLAASAALLNEVGVESIQRHIQDVLAPLRSWIEETPRVESGSDLSPGRRSGILCVRLPDAEMVFECLKRAAVVCVVREGMVRISPHLYNTVDEMEQVVDILAEGVSR